MSDEPVFLDGLDEFRRRPEALDESESEAPFGDSAAERTVKHLTRLSKPAAQRG